LEIRDEILANGRTLTEAAKLIGCATSTLGNWVNGEVDAGEGLLKKLALFLKKPVEEIPVRLPQKGRKRQFQMTVINDASTAKPPLELRRVESEKTLQWLARWMDDETLTRATISATQQGRSDVARVLLDLMDFKKSLSSEPGLAEAKAGRAKAEALADGIQELQRKSEVDEPIGHRSQPPGAASKATKG